MHEAAGRGAALVGAAVLLTTASLAAAPHAAPSPAVAATGPTAEGAAVYYRTCAVCHGNAGQGLPGTGVTAGPALVGLPVAYVDQVLRTGRMPIAHEEAGVREQRLSDAQRQALVAWARDAFELTGEVPQVGAGDAGPGQVLYTRYCSACHGATAGGGTVGDGNRAPSLVGLEPVTIAEAARVGPFSMPAFDEGVLTDDEIADIAAFVQHVEQAPATPLGLVEVNQVVAAVFVVLVTVAGVAVAVVVGRIGAPGRRREDVPTAGPAA